MKVKIFIDGQNFYTSMLTTTPKSVVPRVNYDALAIALISETMPFNVPEPRQFAGAHYYMGVASVVPFGLEKFLYGLELRTGFFVTRETRIARDISCYHCNKINTITSEKGVDTRLSVDMVHFAATHAMDIAILCSGDEDFIPAIQAVNALGVQTWVASWARELSPRLRSHCFGHIDLSKLADKFTFQKEQEETSQ